MIFLTVEPGQKTERSVIIEIIDEIIIKFCDFNGGMEFAMPIIRTQFERLKIDHTKPSREDLNKLVKRLLELTEEQMGPETANEAKREFWMIMKKLGPNNSI